MNSIAKRVHRTFVTFSIASALIMVLVVVLVNEDLERTMLEHDLDEELNFLLQHRPLHDPFKWETGNLKAVYLPAGMKPPSTFPTLFLHIPTPYSGEQEFNGNTYLIRSNAHDNGRYYVAKNITHFEEREALFEKVLAFASFIMIISTYGFAKLSSRRLVKPLQELSLQIQNTPVGKHMPRLPLDYRDAELFTIAETFNSFLDELEAFVIREQSLLSLASHELRTPIAVISGAVDILQQRGQLGADDQKTIERIKRATKEMEANVNILLKLSRRSEGDEKAEKFVMTDVVEEVIEDLEANFGAKKRVKCSNATNASLFADKMLVKMLVRNLVQNALQHTHADIQVRIDEDKLEIQDEGSGMPPVYKQLLKTGLHKTDTTPSGLGLFIVTLICERLNWHLVIQDVNGQGTLLQVVFNNKPLPSPIKNSSD